MRVMGSTSLRVRRSDELVSYLSTRRRRSCPVCRSSEATRDLTQAKLRHLVRSASHGQRGSGEYSRSAGRSLPPGHARLIEAEPPTTNPSPALPALRATARVTTHDQAVPAGPWEPRHCVHGLHHPSCPHGVVSPRTTTYCPALPGDACHAWCCVCGGVWGCFEGGVCVVLVGPHLKRVQMWAYRRRSAGAMRGKARTAGVTWRCRSGSLHRSRPEWG